VTLLIELGQRCDANKHRFHQQAERLMLDRSQINARRTSINVKSEILSRSLTLLHSSVEYLRTSYVQLKVMLDENSECLQTISKSTHFPCEQQHVLRVEHERMKEEFIERFRAIEDLPHDLMADYQRWRHFNAELQRLETLFREIGSMRRFRAVRRTISRRKTTDSRNNHFSLSLSLTLSTPFIFNRSSIFIDSNSLSTKSE
jgi:hypothetical protein